MACHMSFATFTHSAFIPSQALIFWWPTLDPAFGLITRPLLSWHLYLLHPTFSTVHPVIPFGERSIHRNHFFATVTSIKDLKQGFRPDRSTFPSSAPLVLPERLQWVQCVHHPLYDSVPVHNWYKFSELSLLLYRFCAHKAKEGPEVGHHRHSDNRSSIPSALRRVYCFVILIIYLWLLYRHRLLNQVDTCVIYNRVYKLDTTPFAK